MNNRNIQELEDLISAYVDGTASQRQQTELKRLMLHDPALNQRIRLMEKQVKLLNALPVESAPTGLANEVLAALERQLILQNCTEHHHAHSTGRARRAVSAAAMLLLPLGLLTAIVFQIIKPPVTDAIRYESTDQVIGQAAAPAAQLQKPAVPEVMPFNGVLTFTTHQFMTVSNYVEKRIFDQGLMELTVPARTADTVTYRVTASPEQVTALLDALQDTWARGSVTLSVPVNPDAQAVEIANVKLEQVKTLAAESSQSMFGRLAARYASANEKAETFYAKGQTEEELGPDGLPLVNRPILTGRNAPAPAAAADDAHATVRLTLVIQRPAD
jgi:hypothetical protein